MIAELTGFGLNAGVALSAPLTSRLATFSLPMNPGWLAPNTMRRGNEVRAVDDRVVEPRRPGCSRLA